MAPHVPRGGSLTGSPGTKLIRRRTVLRAGVPAAVAVAGMQPAVAEPLDGKGNDVCPCVFGITDAVPEGTGTVVVSGHGAVANPPEEVTVRVWVRGARGARAIGSATFVCRGVAGSEAPFSVSAAVRGVARFESGDDVHVDATAHINPDDAPAIGAGTWEWDGRVS